RERLVEGDRAEHRPQRAATLLIDGDLVAGDAEERSPGVDDLAEDGRGHLDGDVVAADDLLAIARARNLTDVDQLELVDEGHQQDDAGLADGAILTEPLDDADLALLHQPHAERDQDDDD